MKRAIAALVLAAGAVSAAEPLATVGDVDLARYAGQWHEVAKYPNRFQQQCVGDTTATYALRDDGKVSVVNRCRARDDYEEVSGVARRVDGRTDRLQVSFLPAALRWLPIGWGDYWVIDLDEAYQLVAVSEPSQEYLWILARTPQVDPTAYNALLTRLTQKGFDVSKLELTRQD